MTEELFRKFAKHDLDEIDLQRVSVESYNTVKELVLEMERMCTALQDYCYEHRLALQLAHVSLIIQGSFPGMASDAEDRIGRVGYIFGSKSAVEENLKNIIETQETAPVQSVFQTEG